MKLTVKDHKDAEKEQANADIRAECPHVAAMREDDQSHDLWFYRTLDARVPDSVIVVALACDDCAASAPDDRVKWRLPYKICTEEELAALHTADAVLTPLTEYGKQVVTHQKLSNCRARSLRYRR